MKSPKKEAKLFGKFSNNITDKLMSKKGIKFGNKTTRTQLPQLLWGNNINIIIFSYKLIYTVTENILLFYAAFV